MPAATRTVTYEEYIRMPECELGKEEVVDGEIITMPPASESHAAVISELLRSFLGALPKQGYRVLGSSFGIVIRQEPLQVRNPDVAVFNRDNYVVRDRLIYSAPQLAVEVLSPSNTRKEMSGRLRDDAEIGVPEVWLMSIEARTIEVLLLKDGDYTERRLVNEGTLSPRHFPQVSIQVAELWD